MRAPALPPDEQQRLDALQLLGVLDTPEEERFDRITRVAQRALQVPIALVSLIDRDRQWFKSRQGLDVAETPRQLSFCGHAILEAPTFVVPDAHVDERFADNPLVTGSPHVRFYAGRPLRAHGRRVGTLCVIDHVPRELSDEDLQLLEDLALLVENELLMATRDTVDATTGLSNLTGLGRIAPALGRLRAGGEAGLLLRLELVGFDSVSRFLGAKASDDAVAGFARTLLAILPPHSLPARLDATAFAAIVPDGSAADVGPLVGELRRRLKHAFDNGTFPGRFDVAVRSQSWLPQVPIAQQLALVATAPLQR